MKIKITKDYWRWLVWIVVLGVLYYLGNDHFHLKQMKPFLIIMVAIPFLILIPFWFLRDKAEE